MAYKVFLAIALPILAVAWIAYYLWQRHLDELEKDQPKQASQHLQKGRSEVSDWAQKMAAYKPPKQPSDPTSDPGDTPS